MRIVWAATVRWISIETEGQWNRHGDVELFAAAFEFRCNRFDSVDHAAHVSYRRNWGTDLIAGSATNDAEVIVTNGSAKLTRQ
jgi:hypothetical protein